MPSVAGLLDVFRVAHSLAEPASQHRHRSTRLSSPWSTGDLERVVFSDLFGANAHLPVTRAEAMSVPAHARGRHLLVGTIAPAPLRAFRGDAALATQPSWLYRTDVGSSPQLRMAWTVDDLVHYGWSLWAVQRSGDDSSGPILDAVHVPYADWDVDQDARIVIAGMPVNPRSVVLFEGLHEGVLQFGADTLRTAKKLERTVAAKAAHPTPAVELHDEDPDNHGDLTRDEANQLVADFIAGREDPNGSVTYTPRRIKMQLHGEAAGSLLIDGRNASAVDVARHLGLPASLIDATGPSASLKYETAQGRSLEFNDYSVGLYTTPIAARLSLDDCTPRGTRIGFDMSDKLAVQPSPTGPTLED